MKAAQTRMPRFVQPVNRFVFLLQPERERLAGRLGIVLKLMRVNRGTDELLGIARGQMPADHIAIPAALLQPALKALHYVRTRGQPFPR